jgi:large subunit ribosomal protein L14
MIQVQTWLNTIDNSGARFVECIHTIGGFNRKYAYPGDYILVSVKQLRLVRKVKVGQIHLALVTRTRKRVAFKDGTYSRSQKNIVLIINQKKRILSTRIFGWVSRKLRRKKFLRILIICGRYII